jgi:hypothetical protein
VAPAAAMLEERQRERGGAGGQIRHATLMGGRNGAEENEADNGNAERSAHLLHRADNARRNAGVLLGNVAQHDIRRCAGTWRPGIGP